MQVAIDAAAPNGERAGLWLDEPDAEARAGSLSDAWLSGHLTRLIRNGLTIIEQGVPPELCDAINRDFADYCRAHPEESVRWTTETGRHSRLTNFHLVSAASREALLTSPVMTLLDCAFERRTAICSSLYFEQSTQQRIHRDSPFFCTNPYGQFFGVWIALEDVAASAGPLHYVPGGHKLSIDRFSYQRRNPQANVDAWYDAYSHDIETGCSQSHPVPALPKKGDIVVWHPELPHGGGLIEDRGSTRLSIVFHVIPEAVATFGPDVFFGVSAPTPQSLEFVDAGWGRTMYRQAAPAFAPNF
jgi:hypothetical protein